MIYNIGNKGSAATAINNAINKLKSCKSVTINIPSDFEEAGTIKSALDIIKNINLSGIKSDFESAVAGFDAAESATDGVLMEFRGLLNSLGIGNKTKQKGKKDNHDVYHQIEKGRKIKNYNHNLSNQLQSGTMYNLNHLTKEQKEKINKGIEEETTRKNAGRLRSSIVNELVSVGKGLYKMGENITDFLALRDETLQEEHLRTIYTSNAQYAKEHGEEYEKKIEKMRAKTLSYVAKDHTETVFNKLYKENAILKEINERAYNPFKTTGVAYKVGEQTAPVISAITVSTVAPHAASVIIPTIIGMNSGGRSSEEYLRQKKQTQNNWKTKENLDNAIKYGNAVGLWDAAQYAVGMNLFKFNPTGSVLGNSAIRVGIDTGLNALDTPFKASVYSAIDEDIDFKTAYEQMGGNKAVATSAVLGFGGSVFGEVIQNISASKTANQIYEMQGVDPEDLYDEVKTSLKSDIMSGKISEEDAYTDDFLINYAKSKGYSQKTIENWITEHYDKIEGYGIDQGIYNKHFYYETASGKKLKNNRQYTKALKKNETILIKHDDYVIAQAKKLAERYQLDLDETIEITEIMDTPGGMCSFASSAEAIAYLYKDIPDVFEQKFGFKLYRETGGINEELYVDYFINSNQYLVTYYDPYTRKPMSQLNNNIDDLYPFYDPDTGEQIRHGLNELFITKESTGRKVLKDRYRKYATLYQEDLINQPGTGTLKEYLNNKGVTDNIEVNRVYGSRPTGFSNGSIEDVIDAINNGESVNLTIAPYLNAKTKKILNIELKNRDSLFDKTIIGGNHAVNVVGIKGDEVMINTWGRIWSVKLSELQKKAFIYFASAKLK